MEKLYKVSEDHILHIHGSVKDPDNIVVGHDANEYQMVKYAQEYNKSGHEISFEYCDIINHELIKGAKNVKNIIKLYDANFYQYCDIEHFIIMGFSFSDIDLPYIKKIISVNKFIENAVWTCYWHVDKDKLIKNKLIELGINENKIFSIHW